VRRLDDIAGDLLISAVRLQYDARGALYGFVLQEQLAADAAAAPGLQRRLAHGRLALWRGSGGP
jgi:hypothetical protein